MPRSCTRHRPDPSRDRHDRRFTLRMTDDEFLRLESFALSVGQPISRVLRGMLERHLQAELARALPSGAE